MIHFSWHLRLPRGWYLNIGLLGISISHPACWVPLLEWAPICIDRLPGTGCFMASVSRRGLERHFAITTGDLAMTLTVALSIAVLFTHCST